MNLDAPRPTHLRWLLGLASWSILGLVVVGILANLPRFAGPIEAAPPWSLLDIVSKLIGLYTAVALLTAWGAGVWHVAVNPRFRSPVPRALLVALMVVGNALAGVLYYFLYLVWQDDPASGRAAA